MPELKTLSEFKAALALAVQLLAQREHSQRELVRKLELRQFDTQTASGVADYCQQQGWQSDERYTETYIRLRSQKGYGPRRISIELNERGIESSLLSQGLKDAEIDWAEIAEAVLLKRTQSHSKLTPKERAKQQRYLLYRGFSFSDIQPLLERH